MKISLSSGAVWITGITASGKTTLAKQLYSDLRNTGWKHVELIDGDSLRKKLDKQYGHSMKDRFVLLRILTKLIKKSSEKGNIVIISAVGHKKEMRDFVRSEISHFMEVYLDCPANVCAERDYKGLYQKALTGDYELFPGVTEPYEMSEKPELVLLTAQMSIHECSKILLQAVIDQFCLR